MRKNELRRIIAGGGTVLNAWLSIPNAFSAETMAHQGWDSVTIDLQHGAVGYQAAVDMMTAISTTTAVPMVRVPWNEPIMTAKLLDAGAYGIICPNIDTADECERFVSACRYAPRGTRSVGPKRAVLYGGADYLAKANETILTMAQVESAKALINVKTIAAVKELDVVFIGPTDLGLSLGREPKADQTDPIVVQAIDDILDAAKSAGKRAAIYCKSVEYSKAMIAKGFDLVVVTSDEALLSSGAAVAAQFR